MHRTSSSRRSAKFAATFVGVAALVAALAACGSSDSSSPSSGGSGSGSSSSTAAAEAAKATAITQKWINEKQTISGKTPLKSPAPSGKTFVWLNCEIPACTEIGKGLKEATDAIGWKLQVIQYDQADISALVPAMQRALSYNPVGVGLSGLPQAVWQSEIPAYQKAGVPLIVGFVGPTTNGSTLIGNIGDGPNLPEYGSMIANWFISDSKATGSALNVRVDSLQILKGISDGVASTVKSGCTGCSVTDLNTTLQDVESGAIKGQIVAALQRNSSIKYVLSPQGGFISGLPAALHAAGLNDIKIAAVGSSSENLTDLKAGTEHAMVGGAFQVGGFEMIDVALRHLEGMTVDPYDGGLPKQLLVQSSDFTPVDDYPPIEPFIPQFKALWKVS
ncbi:MAG TPA: substrate-binding domain-containing protein [Nocardioides sp.]|uniref:sugar ABC transporter substrate-binding protein n=1 Tax=Nocardioides sp. TaxID=35761 RepID=UPI002E33F30D|nr:substrate-binding domain-containing protein [Nocardioides sp.]HEX3930514.1 substrate-binding domain-containing protein [Nocardioides sp.]